MYKFPMFIISSSVFILILFSSCARNQQVGKLTQIEPGSGNSSSTPIQRPKGLENPVASTEPISVTPGQPVDMEKVRKMNERYKFEHNQAVLRSATYQIMESPPEIFLRELYVEQAETAKNATIDKLNTFLRIEPERGTVSSRLPDGKKELVDIHDESGEIIAKLVYRHGLGGESVFQMLEWNDGKQEGVTAYFTNSGEPYKIYNLKNNQLHGPFFEFIRPNYPFPFEEEQLGALVQYIEFENNAYLGLCLSWSPDGKPYQGCRIYEEPYPLRFIPW